MHVHDVTADWADLSAVPQAVSSWAHNGIAVTSVGELIGFHAGQLVTFDRNGHVLRSVKPGLTEGHGITLVWEGDEEYLWVSDPGFVFAVGLEDGDEKWSAVFGKGIHVESRPPRVVKMTVDGEILVDLPVPPSRTRVAARHDGRLLPVQRGRRRRKVRRQRRHLGGGRVRIEPGTSIRQPRQSPVNADR